MPTLSTRLKAGLGVLTLATTAFVAVGVTHPGEAQAASCLGDQQEVNLPSGTTRFPSSGYLKTTSKCQDINLRANIWAAPQNVRAIKVCFRTAGCQDRWTNVDDNGTWYEIATNVKDDTEYYFKFNSYGKWVGNVAD